MAKRQPKARDEGAGDPEAVLADRRVMRRDLPKGQTAHEAMADFIVSGVGENTVTVRSWATATVPEADLDLTALQKSMEGAAAAVQVGELGGCEALLRAQASSLNTLFVSLTERAREIRRSSSTR